MTDILVGIAGLFVLMALFLSGIELAVAMGLVGLVGFCCVRGVEAGLSMVAQDFFDVFGSYGFTVIPLFIFMGQVAFNAGIAKKLYNTGNRFIGHVPGGLAIATVLGACLFKAISGSAIATAATFSSVAIPEMDRYGYSKKLSTGIVAIVGTLGILIPPSGALIIFGMITEQSIGRLFLAGIIPGLMIALFFVFIIYGWCKINPSIGPQTEKSTWKERRASLPSVVWVVVIFLMVMGGLIVGFFTPTEGGSIGTFLVILLVLAQGEIGPRGLIRSVAESLRSACMVMMLIACSMILGHFLTATKISLIAGEWIGGLPLDRNLIMILILLIYQIGGSIIDDQAFLILATPIFFPAVLKLGFDPIWFGMIMSINMMIGVVIPPVAMNVFVVKNITGTPLGVIYKGVYPFLASLVVCGALLFLFPKIALFLPNLLMK
jgi:C4-dicarboxylate transporter DctM subunit